MKRTVILSAFIDRVCTKLNFFKTVVFVPFGLETSDRTSDRSKPAKCSSPRRGRNNFFPFYFFFGHIINILLTELGRSVWENLDLDRWYRPHCVRSVLATSVKILPYRPPARLIRTNYSPKAKWILSNNNSTIFTEPEDNNCFSIIAQ